MNNKIIAEFISPFTGLPTHQVASISKDGKEYTIRQDSDGNAFVSPLPSEKELLAFYNKPYFSDQGSQERSNNQLTTILKSKHFIPEGKALDIGCGNGYLLHVLKQAGLTVLGIDFSKAAIESARNSGLSTNEVLLGGIESLPNHSKFDYIMLMDVLEHVREPKKIITDIASIMSSHTTLFIKTMFHDDWYGQSIGSDKYWQDHSWEHIYVPSIKGLAFLMLKNGLELLEVFRQEKSGPILSARKINGSELNLAETRVQKIVMDIYSQIERQ
ncbi:MAG: hypothetical protein A2Y40_10860 [Candidatus Margulisbacteria bacterium GWF2_35_9]|nr:MAG: hypothetical protein A2Y40_10860 [Candidatus Margulisbacteria bacterium GWF2_35_9]